MSNGCWGGFGLLVEPCHHSLCPAEPLESAPPSEHLRPLGFTTNAADSVPEAIRIRLQEHGNFLSVLYRRLKHLQSFPSDHHSNLLHFLAGTRQVFSASL